MQIPLEFISNGESETFKLAKKFAKEVTLGSFVALFGDLGAGKTVFVKGLSEGLGFFGNVCSPTFAIINEYIYKNDKKIVHCDMYRIASEYDLETVGFYDYLLDKTNIIITEWSENVEYALPADCFKVQITYLNEMQRLIKIEKGV